MKSSATDYLSKLEENKSSSETESELKERVRELSAKEELQDKENEELKTTIRDTVSLHAPHTGRVVSAFFNEVWLPGRGGAAAAESSRRGV